MSITKENCLEFFRDPTKNPLTGRRITEDGPVYKKLQKQCQQFRERQLIPKPRDYVAPSMGPVIAFNYNGFQNDTEVWKNKRKMVNYVFPRIYGLMHSKDPISKMEAEELLYYAKYFNRIKEDHRLKLSYQKISLIEDRCKEFDSFMKNNGVVLIDDVPKEEIEKVSKIVIHPSREDIRDEVLRIFNHVQSAITDMKLSLDKKKIMSDWASGRVYLFLKDRYYIDCLIKDKIFQKDEIYEKVFTTEFNFEQLEKIYEEFKNLKQSLSASKK